MNILTVRQIITFYGKSHILFRVSLEVPEGQIVGLMGRNGAGKSTTLKSIIGIVPAKSGSILYKNDEIRGWAPFKIARMGIGYVPEDRRLFSDLTVLENLEVMIPRGKASANQNWNVDRIFEFFPRLNMLKTHRGMELSGGEQQMLIIARTLMANPELLLLDEPTEGLAPLIVEELRKQIQKISKMTTILVAEPNMAFVMNLIQMAYIIDNGEIVFHCSMEELRANRSIQEKFLGV
jgi:branched-chain amino acid transport system ATP-binding protein